MSWFTKEEDYNPFPEKDNEPEVTINVEYHYPGDDPDPVPTPPDSGFETPENYLHMISDSIQNTR